MDESLHPYVKLFSTSPFVFHVQNTQQIEQRRAALNDVLLFDILLTSGGIRAPDTLYPPLDVSGLSRLLHAIEGSRYDNLKKNCLVYFLLKWHKDEREKGFAEEKSIMPQFVALADAYWYLDSGYNVARAISNLSDPRLNRDYASKIMQAIDLENKPQLIVKYVRSAQPLLTEPDDIDLYTICLAEGSLLDAWQFVRTFHDRTRARLLEKLLRWTVTPLRPDALSQFLSIPLTKGDENLLQDICTKTPAWLTPPALYILQDLACTRLVQVGRYVDAIKLDRRFCSVPLKEGWPKGGDEGRRKMIQELVDALPSVERAMLDADVIRGPVGTISTPAVSKELALDLPSDDSGTKKRPLSKRLAEATAAMDSSFQSSPGGDSSLFGSRNRSILGASTSTLFGSNPMAQAANQSLASSTVSNNPLFASTSTSNPLFASTTSSHRSLFASTTSASNPLFASTTSTSSPLFASTISTGSNNGMPQISLSGSTMAGPLRSSTNGRSLRTSTGGPPPSSSALRGNAFFQPSASSRDPFKMVPLADVTMNDDLRMEEEEAVRGLGSFTPDASLRASAMAGDTSMWDAEEAVRGLEELEDDGDASMHVEPQVARSPARRAVVPGGWSTPEPMTPPPAQAPVLQPTPSPVRAPKAQTNGKARRNGKSPANGRSDGEHESLMQSVPGSFAPPPVEESAPEDDHDRVSELPPPVKEKVRKPKKRSSVAGPATSWGSIEDESMSARRRSSRLSGKKRK